MSQSPVESPEDSFNKSEMPVQGPPSLRRKLTLSSLLLVGLSALYVFYLLIPDALYSVSADQPQQLGPLASADLPQKDTWVSASATPGLSALSFTRVGAKGSFRLTRAQQRDNVWLLLPVPKSTEESPSEGYVPPSHFVGRLSHIAGSRLLPGEIEKLIEQKSESFADTFVLVEGDSPHSQKPKLFAAILLALLATACLSSAVFLWTKVRSALPQS